jgi:hypothetical protein
MSSKIEMPNPTEAELASPEFEAIWQLIKSWDVNVPSHYEGYCGANGSHVKMILDALDAAPVVERQPPHQIHDCCASCMHGNDAHGDDGRCPSPFSTVWHAWDYDFAPDKAPPELAELQAAIARLTAENERLKGGQSGEIYQFAVNASSTSWTDVSKEVFQEYAHRGGWSTRIVYASQPAPVSVVPEGWKLVPIEPTERMMKVARGLTLQQEQTPSAEYRAMVKAAPACLDKVKELNQ